jgi:hypothetical protein
MFAVIWGHVDRVTPDRGAAVVSRLIPTHEAVLVLEGLAAAGAEAGLLVALRAGSPRFRFAGLVPAVDDRRDLMMIDELLGDGAVPVVAVADGTARSVAELFAARFAATSLVCLDDASASGRPSAAARTSARLIAVPAGWCSRPARSACVRTAAEGCYTCAHLESSRRFLPMLADVARRNQHLDAGAAGQGTDRHSVADAVGQLIAAVRSAQSPAWP